MKGRERNEFWKIKAAKQLLKSSPTAIDVLYLIMLRIDGNVDNKFQPSIFYRSWENHVSPQNVSDRQTYRRTFQIIE